ncbi:MXAN_6521/LA_1396 family lipoprotein [Archangium lansingense]|uniref:MXAN_6521/LA_1396 family lipoprotein n=1 Tax=Archangium lansingense TaxID=2995310 RepID=A0ABT4AK14_9BACT|nr:MXAN_6521/LA_1396 family lipoprotein [Archangium lansinium]MCY1082038.1 MXAN_6521/LA_1396 family lipoprotein [Archangium lansinium]
MNRLALVLGLVLLAGCATVKSSRVRPDYETVDKTQVKRLVVVTQPLPEGKQDVGELWSLIARRYVNQNRDFIAKTSLAIAGAPEDTAQKGLCVEGIEGVLWLSPDVKRTGNGVEAAVKAQLLRCRDGQEVWAAEAAGSWPSEDERYKELTVQYTGELGADVAPYVGPTFRLLSATLDTLPRPTLSEADVEEKIELGE